MFYRGILTLLAMVVSLPVFGDDARPSILASDVVFMYPANPVSQYDDYEGTVVGWGGRPRSRDPRDVQGFQQQVEEAHKRGMRYCGSVDFLVDFAGFIEFATPDFMEAACRDLDGNPLQVPWLWDHKYQDNPAYWFCNNHPKYQAYLRDQVERICLADVDGVHIDDYSGTSACTDYNGGCFCPSCMKGFRDYLKSTFSSGELAKMDINEIEAFDYGQFLKTKGFTSEDYRKKHYQIPLIHEFQNFQNEQMKKRISEIYEYAEKLRGKALVRSVNSSASSPRTIIPSPVIDYFCGECGHDAESLRVNHDPVFIYRMVETLGDRQTATASGQDWAWIKANNKPGFVRCWIAQAYAFGSVFMVPHRQWCFTQELGTHWWHGEPKDFAWLYRFVRQNAKRLDGYKILADVALMINDTNFSKMRTISNQLTEVNIPHHLLHVSDSSSPLSGMNMPSSCHYLIAGKSFRENMNGIDPGQITVIDPDSIETFLKTYSSPVRVESSGKILVSLRSDPVDDPKPIVLHLLNQQYNADPDNVTETSVSVQVLKSMFKNKTIQHAVIHQPQKEDQRLAVQSDDTSISFTVPGLNLWAIVEFQE